jgi:hypothetical protein
MAGRKKRKDYADKLSKKKAYEARISDSFLGGYDPIKEIDNLIAKTFPGKKKKKLGGAIMRNRGGTFKGVF